MNLLIALSPEVEQLPMRKQSIMASAFMRTFLQ